MPVAIVGKGTGQIKTSALPWGGGPPRRGCAWHRGGDPRTDCTAGFPPAEPQSWATCLQEEEALQEGEVRKVPVGRAAALHNLTFSPCREGTESRRLWKLSLMWSRRLRSRALWWARLSACRGGHMHPHTHTHTHTYRGGRGGHGAFGFPTAQLPAAAELGLGPDERWGWGKQLHAPPRMHHSPRSTQHCLCIYPKGTAPHVCVPVRPPPLPKVSFWKEAAPRFVLTPKETPSPQPCPPTTQSHCVFPIKQAQSPCSPHLTTPIQCHNPPLRQPLNIAPQVSSPPQSKATSITRPHRCLF